ncbi:hypothetical protein Tco_1155462, partial [Tanacetum coccineum]
FSATLILNIFLEVISVQDKAIQGRLFDSFEDKEKYKHDGPEVTSSQEGERLQDGEEMIYD